MNPITIIRERIAESKRREEGIPDAPWFGLNGEVMWDQDSLICDCWQPGDSQKDVENISGFIASARSELPMWRSIAEQLLEALEKIAKQKSSQELTEEDRDNADYETAYDMMIDSAQGDLAAIAQQLAGGGIEG